jgi:hypothetical protein
MSGKTGCNLAGEDAETLLDKLAAERGIDRTNESSFDSDDFPKGPFANGGGEADTPQVCAATLTFLENDLTQAGYAYLREAVDCTADIEPGDTADDLARRLAAKFRETGNDVLAEWVEFYPEAFDKANGGPL